MNRKTTLKNLQVGEKEKEPKISFDISGSQYLQWCIKIFDENYNFDRRKLTELKTIQA